jgi:MFS family permease
MNRRISACLALAGGFFSAFCTTGFTNAFGVFQEYYKTHQLRNKTDFDIIWIVSFQSFILFACAPIAGIMVDRKGPFLPLSVGRISLLLGIFMSSLCVEYYQFFLAQGLVMEADMSLLVIPSVAIISRFL